LSIWIDAHVHRVRDDFTNPPAAIDAEAVEEARRALPDPAVLDLVVEAFGALSDKRAKILYALVRRPLCVPDLALTVDASESAVSHHLRLLRDRRLVKRCAVNQIRSTRSGGPGVFPD